MDKTDRCMRCMRDKDKGRFCSECGYDNESRNPERALPVGTILNGKYMVGAVIGEGGFGITYAAWDMLIETAVAIKEYFPSEMVTRDTTLHGVHSATNLTLISEEKGVQRYREGIKRFVQEAENLAKFQRQPGVVSVKDFFYENNTAYMVMEYIRGITLKSYLDGRGGKVGVEETLRMMEPVMKTLVEIHKEGIVHRDISPDNIMVTEDGQMKLIDFGAARFVGAEGEKSLTVILKHGYAPEEQYRSDGKQGPWTDVYALSAVIYRMMTGKVPEETVQRMTEKQDSIHKELAKVPGLPAKVRAGIEKGLALKAGKRYQTIGDLYDGIHSGKKRDIWKWVVAIGVVAAAILCVAIVGIGRMREDAEESFAEEDDTTEEAYDEGIVFDEETDEPNGEEEMEEEKELEEPENIRALREYYNANCLGQAGNPLFVDLSGDGNAEMIVWEKSSDTGLYLSLVVVYQYKNGEVEMVYQAEGGTNYLYIEGNDACILRKSYDSYEKILLKDTEDEAEYSDEKIEEMMKESIVLVGGYNGALLSDKEEKAIDYKSVLENGEVIGEITKIAKSEKETVLDYGTVYDGEDRCIFAVTRKAGATDEAIYVVWGLHDGQMEKLEVIDRSDEKGLYGFELVWEDKIFQFGKSQHYILEFGKSGIPKQYKYCYENGTVRKTDDSRYFVKNENGKIKVNISGNHYEIDYDPNRLNLMNLADVFYYDNQYVEYGAEVVDVNILEQYDNYREILQEAKENLLKVNGISILVHYESLAGLNYEVESAELDYIRKAENGTYYLNYRLYGKMDEFNYKYYINNINLSNFSEIVKEPGEDGKYESNVWACVVLETIGDRLEIENQYIGEKEEQSGTGLAVYYGPNKELKPASKE